MSCWECLVSSACVPWWSDTSTTPPPPHTHTHLPPPHTHTLPHTHTHTHTSTPRIKPWYPSLQSQHSLTDKNSVTIALRTIRKSSGETTGRCLVWLAPSHPALCCSSHTCPISHLPQLGQSSAQPNVSGWNYFVLHNVTTFSDVSFLESVVEWLNRGFLPYLLLFAHLVFHGALLCFSVLRDTKHTWNVRPALQDKGQGVHAGIYCLPASSIMPHSPTGGGGTYRTPLYG